MNGLYLDQSKVSRIILYHSMMNHIITVLLFQSISTHRRGMDAFNRTPVEIAR
jgi:hypothetical protein